MLPARDVLGLHPSDETITIEDKTIIDLDWVAHDIRKFARLMTNHNGYVREQLYSPLVVVSTPAHQELLRLRAGLLSRRSRRAGRPSEQHSLAFRAFVAFPLERFDVHHVSVATPSVFPDI